MSYMKTIPVCVASFVLFALGACQAALDYSQNGYQLKSDGGTYCIDDSDCEDWEFCYYGTCMDEGSGYCNDDSDCDDGYVCMAGYCEEDYYNDYCTDDSDCEDGYVCMYGYCEEDYYECYYDDECDPGYACMDGTCEWEGGEECYDDFDCMPGQTCQDGMCVGGSLPCMSDYDCPQGQVCQAGVCQDDSQGCATNDDCPQGQICDPATFSCIDDPTGCNPPCQDGYVCQNGSCLEESGCQDECSPGSTRCADDSSTLVCGDFDDDSCYELGDQQFCDDGQVCQSFSETSGACRSCGDKWDPCCPGSVCNGDLVCDNGTCADESSGCTDECSMFTSSRVCSDDATRGEGYLECGQNDEDLCLEYGDFIPCDPGMICSNGRCIPDCGDDCGTPDQTLSKCVDDYNRSECIEQIGDVCNTWGDPVPCDSGTHCIDGICAQCEFLDHCDGLDNDCDGEIDEDDDCSGYANPGCSCSTDRRAGLGSGLILLTILALFRRRVNETS